MIAWRVTGDEIGINGNGAFYTATRAEAKTALYGCSDPYKSGPEKIVIRNRDDLVYALNDATGYGVT